MIRKKYCNFVNNWKVNKEEESTRMRAFFQFQFLSIFFRLVAFAGTTESFSGKYWILFKPNATANNQWEHCTTASPSTISFRSSGINLSTFIIQSGSFKNNAKWSTTQCHIHYFDRKYDTITVIITCIIIKSTIHPKYINQRPFKFWRGIRWRANRCSVVSANFTTKFRSIESTGLCKSTWSIIIRFDGINKKWIESSIAEETNLAAILANKELSSKSEEKDFTVNE